MHDKKKSIKSSVMIFALCISLVAGLIAGDIAGIEKQGTASRSASTADEAYAASKEVRGLWVAFCDFKSLGLYNKSKTTYTKNVRKLLNKAKYYGVNAVYFHVRAFDSASWKSETFKASSYLTSKATSSKKAADIYSYDPLAIMIKEAHARGMELHAWMNPYRVTYNYYWDPAKAYSTKRINKAIKELLTYKIDGIHFDDYFYCSKYKYMTKVNGVTKRYKVSISAAKKRAYTNKMIASAYKTTHSKAGVVFGISPAGNVENCMAIGADVKTWMKKKGYIDYIAPQIYWTNHWGSNGKTKMFTDRLKQFKSLNKIKLPMYIGLGLYRTGYSQGDDRGWGWSNKNMRTQVKTLRNYGMKGYILFAATDLFSSRTAKERYYLKGLVKPIYAKSIKFKSKTVTVYKGHRKKLKLIFTPTDTNPKSVTYRSSNKAVVKVSSKGIVKGIKKGKAVITAKTKKGKVARCTIKVRK